MTASPSRWVPGLVPVTVAVGGASLALMAAHPERRAPLIAPAISRHDASWDVVLQGNVLKIEAEADPEGMLRAARIEFEVSDPRLLAGARAGQRLLVLLDGPVDVAVDPDASPRAHPVCDRCDGPIPAARDGIRRAAGRSTM